MSVPAMQPADFEDFYDRLGPISGLVADNEVSEIMVMGTREIYAEMRGKIVLTDARFKDQDELLGVIRFIVESVGRRIDEDNPLCDARLPTGARVHAAIPPVAVDGPLLTIRKFSRDLMQASDLVALGSCSPAGFAFLEACVMARANILISGGASTGKTTLLNILSGYIPDDERIVTIEDAAELQLSQRHVLRLESRPKNIEGEGEIGIRELVRNSLRMRPDRIIVGEVRGAESLDMLQAMNTGHDGSLCTVHANAPRDALSRIETMVLMAGFELPLRAIRGQISSALDLIVQLDRLEDGSRRVVSITEVQRMESEVITLQDLYTFKIDQVLADRTVVGQLEATKLRPAFIHKFEKRGVELPGYLFAGTNTEATALGASAFVAPGAAQ
jgi:pilus assembly protein CpaF